MSAPSPNHPAAGDDDARWLVEVVSKNGDTSFEDVGAPRVDVVGGALVFSNADGNVSFIRAAGSWVTVVPDSMSGGE